MQRQAAMKIRDDHCKDKAGGIYRILRLVIFGHERVLRGALEGCANQFTVRKILLNGMKYENGG